MCAVVFREIAPVLLVAVFLRALLLTLLRPKTAVVSVAAGRPDERPHPYIVSLLKEEVPEVYFTDAVSIPGLVEPVYHTSVHLEVE